MDQLTRFRDAFKKLTGERPFPWQEDLYIRYFSQGTFPASCNLPTGLGKTSVVAVWLIALANCVKKIPRRLVYVVNRRTVVDQTTIEVERLRANLEPAGLLHPLLELCALPLRDGEAPLAISTLRGQFADNREWSADPCRPAVIVGTVDMIGSRLLFSGYGVGFKTKPLHAGFLGQDVLLIHDEAHLEPAFQGLLTAVQKEQERCKEFGTFRVMELSATSRGQETPFELTEKEKTPPASLPEPPTEPIHVVWRRQKAKKTIYLYPLEDEKKLADDIAKLALKYKDSNRAVLVFVRKVEDVEKVVKKLPRGQTQQLTGTLRGLERDRLADPRSENGCRIFARFLKPPKPDASENDQWKIEQQHGTVYLVCTSAGEVGVNLSADHLVCDLSTFDSMAQRFGRVNRFGDRCDSEIHIPYSERFEDGDKFDQRREKTLKLLQQLNGDGCPAALGKLDATARVAAFAPEPTILPATDILFDAWALTTISPPLVRTPLPGRPPVEPYLHGISDWQPPETHVAWRQEVEVITGDLLERYKADELLEDYPLKPHELLRDRSDRVFDELQKILNRVGDNTAIWIEDDRGQVEPTVLGKLLNGDKKAVVNRIAYCRVLLAPSAGGLTEKGTLDGTLDFDPEHKVGYDVADEWFADKERTIRLRVRVRNDDREQTPPEGMRLVRLALDTNPDVDEHEETGVTGLRFWHWYTHPRSADDDGSKSSRLATMWEEHTRDVAYYASRYADALLKDQPELHEVLVLAARSHDLGKQRAVWQRSIGNDDFPRLVYAKSGRLPDGSALRPRKLSEDYRHEFGSLLDSPHMPDLVLHLITTHHGRGRPHFPADEAFDQNAKEEDAAKLAAEVPRRFARLQRKYGRWGLAYLESLLRAADYAASANPSQTGEQL